MKKFDEIKNILIVGGGMMGKNIAFVMTENPRLNVAVYDPFLKEIKDGMRANLRELAEHGVISEAEIEARLARVEFTADIDSALVKDADLVIEAVFEDMEIKRKTFAQLEERCREDAYFCTNSSVMSPSAISAELKHRGRFVGTHFWNPAHLIPLVEVIKSDATADGVAETVMELLASAGKKPCLCKKDVPGFIANRLQHALWREAIYIVEQGIADAETVDTAIKNSFGLRLPQLSALENSDMVGTQLTWNIHSYVLPALCDSHEPSPLLKKMLDEGKLGFKSGSGFYDWTPESAAKCSSDLNKYLIKMLYGK